MADRITRAKRRRLQAGRLRVESPNERSSFWPKAASWALSLIPALTLLWLAFSAGWLARSSEVVKPEYGSKDLAPKWITAGIDAATRYLQQQVGENGQFLYRVNLDPGVEVANRYNLLRHAGTIYAMGMAHERRPDTELAEAIRLACGFLREQIGPRPNAPGAVAVWSQPSVTFRGDHAEAKLGAAGLGLLALLHEEAISPGSTDQETLQGLGEFIASMQKEDGSFYSKYLPEEKGFDDWVSIYYPSEAAFGLVLLYEHSGEPEWLQRAIDAMSYLARTRAGESNLPHDHWSLLTTARLMRLREVHDDVELRQHLNRHASQMAEAILASQERSASTLRHGSFSLGGRSAGSATRLEGLLAALEFLPASETELRERIESACRDGVAFLLRAQVKEGEAAGGFPRSIYGNPEHEARRPVQGRDQRSSEIRIDYVQHALSALLQYEDHLRASTQAGDGQ